MQETKEKKNIKNKKKKEKGNKRIERQDCTSDNPDSQQMVPHTSSSSLGGYSEPTSRAIPQEA